MIFYDITLREYPQRERDVKITVLPLTPLLIVNKKHINVILSHTNHNTLLNNINHRVPGPVNLFTLSSTKHEVILMSTHRHEFHICESRNSM